MAQLGRFEGMEEIVGINQEETKNTRNKIHTKFQKKSKQR